jgi:hypothetical protein
LICVKKLCSGIEATIEIVPLVPLVKRSRVKEAVVREFAPTVIVGSYSADAPAKTSTVPKFSMPVASTALIAIITAMARRAVPLLFRKRLVGVVWFIRFVFIVILPSDSEATDF